MAPYCYRAPSTAPGRSGADAASYRQCQWECVGKVEQRFAAQKKRGNPYAAMIVEPLMQGAAGMIPQPPGWLRQVAEIVRGHGALLIADEVMTGFGRTGCAAEKGRKGEREKPLPCSLSPFLSCITLRLPSRRVQPDFPRPGQGPDRRLRAMAATLTTQAVFDAFLGEHDEFKTFFHGHSYTGNQIGAGGSFRQPGLAADSGIDPRPARVGANAARRIGILVAAAQYWRHPAGRLDCRRGTR